MLAMTTIASHMPSASIVDVFLDTLNRLPAAALEVLNIQRASLARLRPAKTREHDAQFVVAEDAPTWVAGLLDLGRRARIELDECIDFRDAQSMLVELGGSNDVCRIRADAVRFMFEMLESEGRRSVEVKFDADLDLMWRRFGGRSLRNEAIRSAQAVSLATKVQFAVFNQLGPSVTGLDFDAVPEAQRKLLDSLTTPRVVADGIMGAYGCDAAVLAIVTSQIDGQTLSFKHRKWLLNAAAYFADNTVRLLGIVVPNLDLGDLLPARLRVDLAQVADDYLTGVDLEQRLWAEAIREGTIGA